MAQDDDRFNYNIFDVLRKLEEEEEQEFEERGNESLKNLINPKRKREVFGYEFIINIQGNYLT
jgi:hypothetical protein